MPDAPGPVRQLGYVVRDLDEALRHWIELLGVGPFFVIDRLPIQDYTYAGVPSVPHLTGALGYSGDLQIELLAVRDDAPSMWKAFLDSGGEGLHHVAYWTRRFDADLQTLTGRGLVVRHAGQSGTGGRFVYLTPGGDAPPVVELSELDDTKAAVFELVAQAARTWDGSDPIRALRPPVPPKPTT